MLRVRKKDHQRIKFMIARNFALILLPLSICDCESKKAGKIYEDFAPGQNILFAKSTVVFKSKTECDKYFGQLGDYPLELTISLGEAFYIDQNTRASIIEQSKDTVRVLITQGTKNGFEGWTSKLYVSKVFPILPTG